MERTRPFVGVIVLVIKEGKILLGRRIGDKAASGEFGMPGGHVEYNESFAECARREVMEETGMDIEEPEHLGVSNVRQYPPVHYVMILMHAKWKSGEPKRCEPDRCEGWNWYDMDALPEPLTIASRDAVISYLKKQTIFDEDVM